MSAEHRQKMADGHRGQRRSAETRAKLRDRWTPARREAHGKRNAGGGNPAWTGGRTIDRGGYVKLHRPGHPRANHVGYVCEHILVAEEMLGRPLHYVSHAHRDNEVVHHRNGRKDDNRPENLEVLTHGEHTRRHALARHRSNRDTTTHQEMVPWPR